MNTIRRMFRVDRKEIAFLKFIIEAYDGIAVMRTLDAAAGRVMLSIAPGRQAEVDMILRDLGRDMLIEPAPDDENAEKQDDAETGLH